MNNLKGIKVTIWRVGLGLGLCGWLYGTLT